MDNNNQNQFYNYDDSAWTNGAPRRSANPFEQAAPAAVSYSTYVAQTYLWMFLGLLVTFGIAYGMAASGIAYRMLAGAGSAALVIVAILEFACVIAMGALINKISPAVAAAFFLVYAALTGVTFSMYFLWFDLSFLVLVFGVTALFFGGMAAVSLIFKLQLDTIRPFLFGGLILLIVFGILSFFLRLGALETGMCYLGIAIFLGYTAYDTSKIRQNYLFYAGNSALLKKASIFSALQLYLDFVNLFLYIMRILGRRRD